MRSGSIFVAQKGSCQEYYHRKRQFYRALLASLSQDVELWVQKTLHSIDATGRLLSQRLLVGVHVRVFDGKHDWPVVAPQPVEEGRNDVNGDSSLWVDENDRDTGGTSSSQTDDGEALIIQEAQTFDAVAPLPLFVQVMSALLRHIPTVHFFVASNYEGAKGELVGMFGAHRASSIDNRGFSNRSSVDGVKRALVDFIVLGHCALVVHGFGSSFGEEAAAIHLVPTLRLRIGGHIYGADVSFPFCNNAIFENGYNAAQRALGKFTSMGTQQAETAEAQRPVLSRQQVTSIDRFPQSVGQGGAYSSHGSPPPPTTQACYRDASFQGEREKVCTRVMRRSPCLFFERGWGVRGVFC